MKEYTKILITAVPEIMFGIMFFKYSIDERKKEKGGGERGRKGGRVPIGQSFLLIYA